MKKIFLLLICLLMLLLVACNSDEVVYPDIDAPDDQIADVDEDNLGSYDIELKDDTSGEAFSQITVDVDDSVLDGFDSDEARNEAGADLQSILDTLTAQLQDEQMAMHAADSSSTFENEFDLQVVYADAEYISITADLYSYAEGAAHPNMMRYAYVYDAVSGARVSLEQLFGSDYRDELANKIYADVEKIGELDGYYPDLTALLAQYISDDQWYMDADNIYLIYQPYQIAPHARGIIEFAIER